MCLATCLFLPAKGAVTVNGQRMVLPVVTSDLTVRRASSSFVAVQTFGAQLLWHLEGPYALVTLQPGFAHKVCSRPQTRELKHSVTFLPELESEW